MSPYRRFAATGTSLVVAGLFLTAPAHAASAGTPLSPRTAAEPAARPAASGIQTGYKSYSSSAKTSGRISTSSAGRGLKARPAASSATSNASGAANTLYVENDPVRCTSEIGDGSFDDPYCLLQSAVTAAASGETIDVFQTDDEILGYNENVFVDNKTNLTIVGIGVGVTDVGEWYVRNSVGVTVRNMVIDATNEDAVDMIGVQNVTLDSDYLLNEQGPEPVVYVSQNSSGVDITRTTLGATQGGTGISVDANTSNVTIASNIIYSGFGAGVYTTGDSGVDIVGNTMELGCSNAVGVAGSATSISIQDNVFERDPSEASTCAADNFSIGPDVSVDPSAAPGTTSDYNDFIFDADGTAAYSWAGTSYATLAAFQAAVPQGAHDAVDPTMDKKMFLTPAGVEVGGTSMTVDAQPVSASLSHGTANTSAPGYLSADYFGNSSYGDRGAIEYAAPSLAATLTIYQAGARSVEAYADGSVPRNTYATYAYSWGDSGNTPSTDQAWLPHTYAHPGTFNETVTVTDVLGDTSTVIVPETTAGSDYTPLTPARLLDTRHGTGTNGVIAPIGAGKTLALQITGFDSIPATATAVALNLTATDATANGHLNAYPAGTSVPVSSNLDFAKGKNVANMSVVPIGAGGVVDFYNGSAGTVDLIADVSGYFVTAQADGYKQIVPARILDTRTSTGGHKAPLTPSAPVKLKVAGVGGVPADAKAVEVNLTVASPTKPSYVVAYPDGATKPTVSNVNFTTGQTVANAAIVPIGSDGYIDIATPVGSNRMIVDVDGYFSANLTEAPSAYEPVTPFRQLDTRTNNSGGLTEYEYWWLPFGWDFWGNVLTPQVTGAVTNATVTGVTVTSGDLDVFPDNYVNGNLDIPNVSSLNFTKGATVANMVFATPGTDGKSDFWNDSTGNLQLIVDVFGYFQAS